MMTKQEKKSMIILVIIMVGIGAFIFGMKMRENALNKGVRETLPVEEAEAEMIPIRPVVADGEDIEKRDTPAFLIESADYYSNYYREEAEQTINEQLEDNERIEELQSASVNYVENTYTSDGIANSIRERHFNYDELGDQADILRELGVGNFSASTLCVPLKDNTNWRELGVMLSQPQVDKYVTMSGIVGETGSLMDFYSSAILPYYKEGSYCAYFLNDDKSITLLNGNPAFMLYAMGYISDSLLAESLRDNLTTNDLVNRGNIILNQDADSSESGIEFHYGSVEEMLAEDLYFSTSSVFSVMQSSQHLCIARVHNGTVYVEVFGKANLETSFDVFDDDMEIIGTEDVSVFNGIYVIPSGN